MVHRVELKYKRVSYSLGCLCTIEKEKYVMRETMFRAKAGLHQQSVNKRRQTNINVFLVVSKDSDC